MIYGLKPYPEYRPSGSEWVGEVPVHWSHHSLGSLSTAISRRGRPDLPLLSVVRERGVIRRSMTDDGENHNFIPDDLSNYKVVRAGNLVINKMKAWQGSMGIAPIDGVVSPAYYVFSVAVSDARFCHELLRSKPYTAFFGQASDGVRVGQWDLSVPRMRRIPVWLPPDEEQAAIVRFIDHADRQIRRYIGAKQKLIMLLEEQRQAITRDAVTSGIDRDAAVVSTDDPWFPQVPSHWRVLPMGRVILRAVDGPHVSPSYVDVGVPFISARNIKADRWSLDDAKFISEADYREFSKRVKPERGDVLYTKGGTTGVARAVDLDFPFQIWVHVAVLKLNRSLVDASYLAMALNTARCYEQAQLLTRGATNQDLGLGRMKAIALPVPPLAEQREIVEHVQSATADMRLAIERGREEVALAREYRNRLIADTVTGKLDVREAAAGLPDEIPHGTHEVDLGGEDDVDVEGLSASDDEAVE